MAAVPRRRDPAPARCTRGGTQYQSAGARLVIFQIAALHTRTRRDPGVGWHSLADVEVQAAVP